MVPDDSAGIPRAPAYSGTGSAASAFRVRGSHPLRPAFPCCPATLPRLLQPALQPRHAPEDAAGLGLSPFDRLYWGNRYYFLFLPVLRCFSSRRSPPAPRDDALARVGLPHSDIAGSQGICPSPALFAACHVLLRLREPRHPPCALSVSVVSLPGHALRLSAPPFYTFGSLVVFYFKLPLRQCPLFRAPPARLRARLTACR